MGDVPPRCGGTALCRALMKEVLVLAAFTTFATGISIFRRRGARVPRSTSPSAAQSPPHQPPAIAASRAPRAEWEDPEIFSLGKEDACAARPSTL